MAITLFEFGFTPNGLMKKKASEIITQMSAVSWLENFIGKQKDLNKNKKGF